MSSVERTQNGSKGGEVRQVEDNLIRGLKSKISNTGRFWIKVQSKE